MQTDLEFFCFVLFFLLPILFVALFDDMYCVYIFCLYRCWNAVHCTEIFRGATKTRAKSLGNSDRVLELWLQAYSVSHSLCVCGLTDNSWSPSLLLFLLYTAINSHNFSLTLSPSFCLPVSCRLCLPHLLCQRVSPESPERVAWAEDPARGKLKAALPMLIQKKHPEKHIVRRFVIIIFQIKGV